MVEAEGPSPLKASARKADEWEIDGPDDDDQERRVSLWTTLPYERLTPSQLDARAALRLRLRRLTAAT